MALTVKKAFNISDDEILGYSTGTTWYTLTVGMVVCKGTDGASVANRLKPVTDSSEEIAIGVAVSDDDESEEMKGNTRVAEFPCVIVTDNVDSTNPPEVGVAVYLLDAGTWSDTDTNSSLREYGVCTYIDATLGLYTLKLHDPVVNTP